MWFLQHAAILGFQLKVTSDPLLIPTAERDLVARLKVSDTNIHELSHPSKLEPLARYRRDWRDCVQHRRGPLLPQPQDQVHD